MSQNLSKPITEYNFSGYDDTHPAELLPSGTFTKVDNAFVTDNKIEKVFGSSAIASSLGTYSFNGLSSFELVSSAVKYLVVSYNGASNAQLYKWTGTGGLSAIGSSNLTKDTPINFESAGNYLFGFNGIEAVDWDGTTVTKNRAGVPVGTYAKWFHNYLFVARNSTYPSRLYWSDLGVPTSFTGANYVDVNPGDSDSIMGIAKTQDELLVFKRNTVWAITGWSGTSFSSTTIATENTNSRIFGFGCVAPRSIVEVGTDVYYFSMLGNTPVIRSIYKTINSVTLDGGIISANIKATLDTISLGSLDKIVGTFDGRYVYWSIPVNGSSINNKIVCLDTWNITKYRFSRNSYPFTTMTGKNASYFTTSSIPGYATVYYTDSTIIVASPVQYSGLVMKFDKSIHTDNGTDITLDVITRMMMLDSSRKVHWKYMYLKNDTGVNSTLYINARLYTSANFVTQKQISLISNSPGLGPTGTFTLGVSSLGGSILASSRVNFAGLTGKMIQVQFKETSSNPVSIYEHSLYGVVKGLRDS